MTAVLKSIQDFTDPDVKAAVAAVKTMVVCVKILNVLLRPV